MKKSQVLVAQDVAWFLPEQFGSGIRRQSALSYSAIHLNPPAEPVTIYNKQAEGCGVEPDRLDLC